MDDAVRKATIAEVGQLRPFASNCHLAESAQSCRYYLSRATILNQLPISSEEQYPLLNLSYRHNLYHSARLEREEQRQNRDHDKTYDNLER
jgi:hypothetical protein